jgi:hypothetical protein
MSYLPSEFLTEEEIVCPLSSIFKNKKCAAIIKIQSEKSGF